MCCRPVKWHDNQVEKGPLLCCKHKNIQKLPTGLACECTNHSIGVTASFWHDIMPFASSVILPFLPLKMSENRNSSKENGQVPTHTYSKISTYSWHTSCLWLIKTCFIYETRHCEALLISSWWNNKAADVSTHTPPHEIKQFTLCSKDFCYDRNQRDLIMGIMPSLIQWKVKTTREIASAYCGTFGHSRGHLRLNIKAYYFNTVVRWWRNSRLPYRHALLQILQELPLSKCTVYATYCICH